MVGRSGRLI
jgi:hypothetical protein